MNRQIKFRYVWKDYKANKAMLKYYTLEQIAAGQPYDDMSDMPLFRNFQHVATDQWTGCTDIDGKEIYENDLIKFEKDIPESAYKVEFARGRFALINKKTGIQYPVDIAANFSVIGNTHTEGEK